MSVMSNVAPGDGLECVPYRELTSAQRLAVEAWLRRHEVAPCNTPTTARIEFDRQTGEWVIEQFDRSPSGALVLELGVIRQHTVRRVSQGWLPWPTRKAADA